jgi:hypothetical protein
VFNKYDSKRRNELITIIERLLHRSIKQIPLSRRLDIEQAFSDAMELACEDYKNLKLNPICSQCEIHQETKKLRQEIGDMQAESIVLKAISEAFNRSTKLRILVCGSRNWKDEKGEIKKFINSLPENAIIVEGAAKGADSLAAEYAKNRGLRVNEFPANWDAHGKAAGFIRNKEMLEDGYPNVVVAYSKNLKTSKGTLDMVTQSMKAGIPVFLNLTDFEQIKNPTINEYGVKELKKYNIIPKKSSEVKMHKINDTLGK